MIASNGRLVGRCLQGRRVPAPAWTRAAGSAVLPRAAVPVAPSLRSGRRLLARGYASLDLLALDQKWRDKWASAGAAGSEKGDVSSTQVGSSKYILPMFPYPSGNLHLGHLRVYTIADVIARFYRLRGHDVLLPMGFDSFGLPAENAALQRGVQPAAWTRDNIANMKSQLGIMNGSFDWSRELSTCEPDFYKHTQRIFLMLHEQGLAYQAEAEVNYDPVDRTVLANEQVDASGRSWRSGAVVEKRLLRQWFLRISAFREALLEDLDELARGGAWPERVLAMQRNWLGRSAGALVKFPLLGGESGAAAVDVFTTRIDTLMGVQYIALAAAHPLVQELARQNPELQAFLDTLPGLPADSSCKAGFELPGLRAINPLAYHDQTPAATKASLPVYVASYVLGDYGEGAVMGVPGHDERDHAFWKQHRADEPVRVVIEAAAASDADKPSAPFVGHGVMNENSGPFHGRSSEDAAATLLTMLEAAQLAAPAERWRLRDWLISRQRYWGAPIPIVHCDDCGAVPVPVADLPVRLPDVDDHFSEKRPGNPLAGAAAADWANVPCPQCRRPARRETDTMDTFVDSSWYYMRFVDPHNADAPFSPAAAAARLPVDIYIGGIEHAILHLLYARFVYKALMASPLGTGTGTGTGTSVGGGATRQPHEPFARLITQGMVHGKTYVDPATGRFLPADKVDASGSPGSPPREAATGAALTVSYEKMSKSKHNGIDPTDFIRTHGADATRAHVLFQAPVADVLSWDDEKVAGITRWLGRLYDIVAKAGGSGASESSSGEEEEEEEEQKAVTEDLRRRSQALAETANTDADTMARWDADSAVWRDVQAAIASVTASYERVYSLNTVVSDLMRLTNSLAAHEDAASPRLLRCALSALVRMLAPVAPAFAEECWSVLRPTQPPLFARPASLFPSPDRSLAWLQPRLQNCAVQLNGKLRCAVAIPRPPSGLAGDALRDWLVAAILQTDEGKAKLAGDSSSRSSNSRDIRQAKKAIVVRDGKLVNFLF